MKRARPFQIKAIGMMLACLAAASTVSADQPIGTSNPLAAKRQAVIADISLQDGGVLVGRVIDTQRKPVASQPVRVVSRGELLASATTDQQGRFAIQGMKAGTHTIVTTQGSGTFQFWAPKTAPPSAQQDVLIVAQPHVVIRGQGGECPPDRRLLKAAVIGAGIGVGVWAIDYNPSGS